jgi:hypothetical protein
LSLALQAVRQIAVSFEGSFIVFSRGCEPPAGLNNMRMKHPEWSGRRLALLE